MAHPGRAPGEVARVLGIDPGLTRCGFGVVAGPPASPEVVDVQVLRTGADEPLAQRLQAVYTGLGAAIESHRPTVVAVEQVLFSKNVRTAMVTGQAMGVALLAAAEAGLPVATYAPTQVKLTVAGHGGASKDGVARMVAAQLGLAEGPSPADAADALAVALCHLASARILDVDEDTTAGGTAGRGGGAPASWEEAVAANPHVREVGGTA